MKQIIADAFILLFSGAARLKNGKEVEYVDEYNKPITIEFPCCPNVTPNCAIVRWYYENGQLEYKKEYQNGKLHGFSEYYYENGQLSSKYKYQNDELHGLLKGYYESGQLKFEHEYQNGKRHGLSKWYHKSGQLVYEDEYQNDKLIKKLK